MLWKSRWTGGWFLRRVAGQPNRARTQDNQILISAYDEILSRTFRYNCLMIGELPVRPWVFQCTHTGRPLGTQEFVHALEESMDRRLVPQKGGRPAKPRPDARQSDLDFGL